MTRPGTPDLDPDAILGVLTAHDVRFVVIGGYAATVHRVPVPPTTDIDITPARDAENLERLVAALREIEAINLIPEAIGSSRPPFFDDFDLLLRRRFWTLVTPHGAIDLVIAPDGFPGGYEDLIGQAVLRRTVAADGTPLTIDVKVASVHHIYLSKRAAGRAKDRRALPALAQRVAQELRGRSTGEHDA